MTTRLATTTIALALIALAGACRPADRRAAPAASSGTHAATQVAMDRSERVLGQLDAGNAGPVALNAR